MLLNEIVNTFCVKYHKDNVVTTTVFLNTLEKITIEHLNDRLNNKKDIVDTLQSLLNDDSKYFKLRTYIQNEYRIHFENQSALLGLVPTADSIGRDLRNWEAASYAKSNIRIERKNVLLIAFALEFNERQCNRLLMSINQHDLHVGGGATETIVGYCLKSGLPFAHAKKLYDIYSKLDTEIYHACVPKSQKKYTHRTKNVKDSIKLTQLVDGNPESNFDSAQNVLIEEKIKTACDDLSDKDVGLLKKLFYESKNFNSSSNRTFSYVKHLIEREAITEKTLNNFYNGLDINYKNILSFCRTGYAGKVTTQPTRSLIILLALMAWCKNENPDFNLCDYINNAMETCGFPLLNDTVLEDMFVIEIGKFVYKNNRSIKYESYEIQSTTLEQCKSKFEVYSKIVSAYLSSTIEPFKDCIWVRKNQFFDF